MSDNNVVQKSKTLHRVIKKAFKFAWKNRRKIIRFILLVAHLIKRHSNDQLGFKFYGDFVVGEALRLIRIFHDVKLSEMAEALEVSPSYLSEIEKGKRDRKVNLKIIEGYANHFNVRKSAILFFAEEIEEKDLKSKSKSAFRSIMIDFLQLVEKYGK